MGFTVMATSTVDTTAAMMLQRIPFRIPQTTSGRGMIRFKIIPMKGTYANSRLKTIAIAAQIAPSTIADVFLRYVNATTSSCRNNSACNF